MQQDKCPLPEVASALSPFIKPRDEVAAIRRSLQAYLQKQLPLDDGTPLSAVNLTAPLDEKVREAPTGLSGVRKAYRKALQSNQAAQARYDALKSDLDGLKHPSASTEPDASSVDETYIPLLRQKEKLRRLKVLERAYASLPALPTEPLEDHLKTQLGAPPTPPASHPPSSTPHSAPDLDAKVLALKKAVLTTQRRAQDQQARNAVAKASLPADETVSNAAKIAGLQGALQELTVWMEEMLGVIADAEADVQAAVPPSPPARDGPAATLDDIEMAYERYLHARRRLVQRVSSPASDDSDDDDDDSNAPLFPPRASSAHSGKTKPTPAELLLPHIARLSALKTQESDLLQQKAHLRRQLGAAEAETAKAVRRLAGESHLVSPGANRGAEWLQASREAGAVTEEVVRERVEAGLGWSRKAREAVEGIEGVPGLMEGLVVKE